MLLRFYLFSFVGLEAWGHGTHVSFVPWIIQHRMELKAKVHTLDIAPLRSESPLQKRSGMARVLKG